MQTTRVDRWLWAVRMFKTRSEATDAIRGGHVRVDGRPAKPATAVVVGSRVEARVHGVDRTLEVVQVIEKRVGAAIAAGCLIDHTPPPPPVEHTAAFADRDRGAGRPTKRDRRQLDRWRSQDV